MRPTFLTPLADTWGRPDGPWDTPDLESLLRGSGSDRLTVVDDERRWSPDELDERIAEVAGGLAAAGVARGDAVSWTATTGVGSVVLYRACWRLGAVAAPLHHRAGSADRDAALAQLDPVTVVDAAEPPVGMRVAESRAAGDDVAVVLFTSGSSGTPKGVLHTHRSLSYKARLMVVVHGLGPDDVVLMPAPLAHISGLLNGVLVPGHAGMRSVLMARWDPERALELIEEHGVTFMVGPPTFFTGLTGHSAFSSARVASLRLVSSGGAGVTPSFVRETSRLLGATVKRTYGSTEAPTVTTSRSGDDPEAAADTDGRAAGAVELRVVDSSTGTDTDTGHEGELWLRGPELFAGYLDPDRNAAALVDGWFRTGDLATLDGDGWLTITGRLKDVIIRGGENISAAEVAAHLESHESVREAVVVGEPDADLGERVAAFVVTSGPFDLGECRRWFDERGVTRFKTPERVVLVDTLPTLASGKPDRAALARRLATLRTEG